MMEQPLASLMAVSAHFSENWSVRNQIIDFSCLWLMEKVYVHFRNIRFHSLHIERYAKSEVGTVFFENYCYYYDIEIVILYILFLFMLERGICNKFFTKMLCSFLIIFAIFLCCITFSIFLFGFV